MNPSVLRLILSKSACAFVPSGLMALRAASCRKGFERLGLNHHQTCACSDIQLLKAFIAGSFSQSGRRTR